MKRKQEDGVEEEEEKKEALEPETKRQKTTEEDQQQPKEQLYLEKLKLASFDALNELSESRRDCPKCFQSRKYFCYDCYIPLNYDVS